MSADKHTPGPWTFSEDGSGGNFRVSAGEIGVVGGCGCCDSPWLGGENYEADARLIAAAPELLKAAQRAADRFGLWEAPTAKMQDALDGLKAAIAKAIGQ